MPTIKITTRRRVTLPAALCEELGLGPGDKLELNRCTVGGETLWALGRRKLDWSWLAAGKCYAKGRSHDRAATDRSIARGWANEDQQMRQSVLRLKQ